jgi:putative inorganic carbon (hco3(-)) transporter
MNSCGLTVLSLVLAFALVNRAEVGTRDWSFCVLVIALVTLACRVFSRRDQAPPLPGLFQWPLLTLVAFGALQIAPLPVPLIRLLSPARADQLTPMASVLGTPKFATLSTAPTATFGQLTAVCCYLLVFLLARDLTWSFRDCRWRSALPLIALAGLESVLGLVQSYSPGSDGIARGTYINRDHFAGFLEMCLPFAALFPVAVWRQAQSRYASSAAAWKVCGLVSVSAVIFAAILRSQSRMGFLAALASLFTIAILVIRTERRFRNSWLLIGSLAIAILLAFLLLPSDPLIARFAELAPTGAYPTDLRMDIWKDTLNLIAAFPLFGCGLGAFEVSFPRFQTSALMYAIDYAHNDYLQGIAELGAPVFLVALLCLLVGLRQAFISNINSRSNRRRYLVLACGGSCLAIFLHSFVDFNLYIPSNAMLLAWIAGILATPSLGFDQAAASAA